LSVSLAELDSLIGADLDRSPSGAAWRGILPSTRHIPRAEEKKMTKRILVPLDGHEDAEAIVPTVVALARQSGATIRLLRVFPEPSAVMTPQGWMVASIDQEMARLEGRALSDFAPAETELAGLPVETVVRYGDPVEEIALEAEAFGADLIAMTARKRGRLGHALAPGVAQRLETRTDTPTLVLHTATRDRSA
jgi:universal stress protein A